MSDAELLALVKKRSKAFDDTIRRRDRREAVAAAVVFVFFALMLTSPSWITRAGVILVLAGSVLSVWMLRRARRPRPAESVAMPLAELLRTERARVDAQIRLLENVLWWYIAPFAIGLVLVTVGQAGGSAFTFGYLAFVAAAAAGIYYLNRKAVRRELRPRRDELTRLLRQIEE